jgi:NAD(P)H-flavin reductase
MSDTDNVYKPHTATITDIQLEAGGARPIRTFTMQIDDPEARPKLFHKPGQFAIVSYFGAGESVFAISSLPNRDGIVQVSGFHRSRHRCLAGAVGLSGSGPA